MGAILQFPDLVEGDFPSGVGLFVSDMLHL